MSSATWSCHDANFVGATGDDKPVSYGWEEQRWLQR